MSRSLGLRPVCLYRPVAAAGKFPNLTEQERSSILPMCGRPALAGGDACARHVLALPRAPVARVEPLPSPRARDLVDYFGAKRSVPEPSSSDQEAMQLAREELAATHEKKPLGACSFVIHAPGAPRHGEGCSWPAVCVVDHRSLCVLHRSAVVWKGKGGGAVKDERVISAGAQRMLAPVRAGRKSLRLCQALGCRRTASGFCSRHVAAVRGAL